MAANMAFEIGVNSRFSVLANDDSDESEGDVAAKNDEAAKKKAKNAKKRAKKKKKIAFETAENQELRSLAFGGKQKHVQQVRPSSIPKQQTDEKPPVQVEDISEWVERDKQFIVNQFQEDLQEALRISVEEENERMLEKGLNSGSSKKKKDHSVKLSLGEFQEKARGVSNAKGKEGLNVLTDTSLNHTENVPKKNKKKKEKNQDCKPINTAVVLKGTDDTNKVNNVETSLDSASMQHWLHEVEKRDIENSLLRQTIDDLREELVEVKKRNKQLCFILGQGEMRDKSEILQQIDSLTVIKDELSTELSEMHSLLEQERSKVSILKLELAKSQVARSKKPSFSENGHK